MRRQKLQKKNLKSESKKLILGLDDQGLKGVQYDLLDARPASLMMTREYFFSGHTLCTYYNLVGFRKFLRGPNFNFSRLHFVEKGSTQVENTVQF